MRFELMPTDVICRRTTNYILNNYYYIINKFQSFYYYNEKHVISYYLKIRIQTKHNTIIIL